MHLIAEEVERPRTGWPNEHFDVGNVLLVGVHALEVNGGEHFAIFRNPRSLESHPRVIGVSRCPCVSELEGRDPRPNVDADDRLKPCGLEASLELLEVFLDPIPELVTVAYPLEGLVPLVGSGVTGTELSPTATPIGEREIFGSCPRRRCSAPEGTRTRRGQVGEPNRPLSQLWTRRESNPRFVAATRGLKNLEALND
jgi:hypothetical protein